MTDVLVDYLQNYGPQLSGDVAAGLGSVYGIEASAARKKIERRSETVGTIENIFPKRAKFLYLTKHYGSPRFWRNLAEALEKSNSAYARTIRALNARGGVMPIAHATAATGISGGSRQLDSDTVFKRLISLRLLQELNVPDLGNCLAFAKGDSYLDELLPPIRARLIAEKVLLASIQDWAAKLGLGSFHSFKLRNSEASLAPNVSNYQFDLTAPSFLGPLATWPAEGTGEPKPGFLALDVLLTEEVSVDAVKPFVYKCQSLRRLKGVGRCLQFFVAQRYSKEALDMLRKAGVVPATPESLFGKEVATALRDLISVLSVAAVELVSVDKFTEFFDRLGKVEGAAGTLRGALLEFFAADVLRNIEGGADLLLNKIYRWNGKDAAEVDVRVVTKDKRIRFIECKAQLPGHPLTDSDVDDWLNRRIKIVREHTLENQEWRNYSLSFEMWVTGELSPEAQQAIHDANLLAEKKKYSISVKYAKDIEELARPYESLRKVFAQHFLKHPLAISDGVYRRIPQNPFAKYWDGLPEEATHNLTPPPEEASGAPPG